MPDIRGRRTLGDGGRVPSLWWEDGPRDPDPADEARAEAEADAQWEREQRTKAAS